MKKRKRRAKIAARAEPGHVIYNDNVRISRPWLGKATSTNLTATLCQSEITFVIMERMTLRLIMYCLSSSP